MGASIAVLAVSAAAQAAAPQIKATWVTEVSLSAARLHTQIDAGGAPTGYRFDYITDAGYQANLKAGEDGFSGAASVEGSAGGGGVVSVARQVVGLQAETLYRYRVFVGSVDGAVAGPERTLTTQGLGGPLVLLDDRGWEMVSPVDKNGGEIQGFEGSSGGGVLQVAAQGGRATFSSASSFGSGGQGAPAASQYVSRRSASGWTTENVSAPLFAGGYGENPGGVPYQLFSTGLSRGLLSGLPYPALAGTGAPAGYRNFYLRQGGGFTALLTHADIAGLPVPPQDFELDFTGASPDLSHIVLSTCAALTDDAVEVPGSGDACNSDKSNLYAWSLAGLRLLNLPPAGALGDPGARLAAPARAISNGGSRVYWTDGVNVYLRDGTQTLQVDLDQGGGGTFETASTDGSVAFFTKDGGLYRYELATETATILPSPADVEGVLGASASGSHIYFLTTSGIFLNQGGSSTEVAPAPDFENVPPSTGTARVSADGNHLAFVSSAQLTLYDNTGESTGVPVDEVYLYKADTDHLTCVSCNPSGERPLGPSSIPGAIANGQDPGATRAYKPRVLSADGRRLFFDSLDSLVLHDSNKENDVYEWEAQGAGSCQRAEGCLQLISSAGDGGASFIDASSDGSDVFFLTADSLVSSDPGSVDLYDARVDGGFPEPNPAIVCEEDSCQPLPSPPDDPLPGTLVPNPGNPPVHFAKTRAKKVKKQKRKAKERKKQKRKAKQRNQRRRQGGRR